MSTAAGGVIRAGHVSGLHAVTRELAAMRAALLRTGDEAHGVRLSVLTLVAACADGADGDQAAAVIERMAVNHPTRAIVLVADPAGEPRIEADLSLSCAASGRGQVCVELVRLDVGGETALHLRSVVGPLLLPDVPVHLWLAGGPPLTQALSPDALELCERIIVDSDAYPDPGAVLRTLARTISGSARVPAIGDLAWRRIRGWRELAGRAFESPELRGFAEGIEDVEVRSAGTAPGAGALLLAGWLTSRLDRPGYRVPAVHHVTEGDGGGVVGVTIAATSRDRRGRVEISGDGGRRTLAIGVESTMRSHSSAWAVEVERPELTDLVGAELEEQGPDPVYAAALVAAAGMQR